MLLKFAAVASSAVATAQLNASAAAKPNDAQIAQIAYTAGQIDVKAAELALQKSKNQEVRDFAENMVRDHKAVNDQALALVKRLNVTPQDWRQSASQLTSSNSRQRKSRPISATRSNG